jgi:hypothetical protein
MSQQEMESFPPGVSAKLKTYVYRLVDPRNGETFYVGKGKGNRVFAHARAEQALDGDEWDNRLKRIHEIRSAGLEVGHVIHRHGLDPQTALEVEAALIDAYPGLTTVMGGSGSSDYGVMHAKEIADRYSAEPAVFRHKALLICINKTAGVTSLYEATRYAWKINVKRAKEAEIILATVQGLIKAAFVADQWLEANETNFPGREPVAGRYGFIGRQVESPYVGKRVPDEYRKRGAAAPVKYTWCK